MAAGSMAENEVLHQKWTTPQHSRTLSIESRHYASRRRRRHEYSAPPASTSPCAGRWAAVDTSPQRCRVQQRQTRKAQNPSRLLQFLTRQSVSVVAGAQMEAEEEEGEEAARLA